MAHRWNVPVLVDGAQAVAHMKVDVQALDCDFYAFSGHKMCGPTGIGVLYGKAQPAGEHAAVPGRRRHDPLGELRPKPLTTSCRTSSKRARRTSPGTIGLGAAVDYLNAIGLDRIEAYEARVAGLRNEKVSAVPGVRIIGTAREKAGVLSFVMEGVHPHDVGTILDREGVAMRTGHHCAQPVMECFGVPATTRASLAFYNSREDIDALVAGLEKVREIFA